MRSIKNRSCRVPALRTSAAAAPRGAALRTAAPGVIVEQPVLATQGDGTARVLEIRYHVVWGRAMVVEYTFGRRGSFIFRRNSWDNHLHSARGRGLWESAEAWVFDSLNPPEEGDSFPAVGSGELFSCLYFGLPLAETLADEFKIPAIGT